MDDNMTLALEFMRAHPSNAARVLERIPIHDAVSFMKRVPPDMAADTVKAMDSMTTIRCFELMEPDAIGAIAEKLPLDIASMILRRMDSDLKDAVINTMSPEITEPLNLMLYFQEGTTGALMDPQCFVLPQDILGKEAIERARGHSGQNASYIYVVDRDHVLVGFINMHEMLHLDLQASISTIIQTDIWRLSPHSDRQAILTNPGWREFHTLPVVDEKGIFLGAIDYQTVRRLEQETIRPSHKNPLSETAAAMGELFWVGLSGLVKGVTSGTSGFQEE